MTAPVGVVVVGHGNSATHLLDAARTITSGAAGLDGVVALDAGAGQTPELKQAVHDAIDQLDRGAGVVVLVDLLGSSPCSCCMAEAVGHRARIVSGLNLAMLIKLAHTDRESLSTDELATKIADTGRRAVVLHEEAAAK